MHPSAVDHNTCETLQNPTSPFILVLHKGQDVVPTLLACAKKMNIQSAGLAGLGALENPTIAYYHLPTQQYEPKIFEGIYELMTFEGNLTIVDGKLFSHIHVTIGDRAHAVFGGHFMGGLVGVTIEVLITPLQQKIYRSHDSCVGLNLIDVEKQTS